MSASASADIVGGGYAAGAQRLLSVPYRPHGRGLEGWDCWGCFGHAREALFGRPVASWAEAYDPAAARDPARCAELIEERLAAWRPVPARAGAAVLLTYYRRPFHVGLMLGRNDFLHCMEDRGTVIGRLSDPEWRGRVEGFYDD